MLVSKEEGRSIFYKANTEHPLYSEIQSFVRKTLGLDQLIERLTSQLGDLKQAFLVGDYAKDIDSGLIDIVLVGEVDKQYLDKLTFKTESLIHRKIKTLVLTVDEYDQLRKKFQEESVVPLWE